jgi:hypothetical protein
VKKSKKLPEPTSSAFLDGYLEALLWSSNDESNESGGEPLDKNYGFSDFSDEALASSIKDCNAFIDKAGHLMDEVSKNDEQHGHDFWLTQNGHGTGFWDRGYGPTGDELADIAKKFGERWPYVGDDGKIHIE